VLLDIHNFKLYITSHLSNSGVMVSGKLPPLEATVSTFWYVFQDVYRI